MLHTQITSVAPLLPFATFRSELSELADQPSDFAAELVGKGTEFQGAFGARQLVYADYVASGRALRPVEEFVLEHVLPFYANSHTESSFCGGYSTHMREQARSIILEHCGGNPKDHAVIFSGSGATSAVNKLVHLLGIRDAAEKVNAGSTSRRIFEMIGLGAKQRQNAPVHVLVGPYEHHSNILPWRESGALVTEIQEAPGGGVNLEHLKAVLDQVNNNAIVVGAFSAASNVTGAFSNQMAVSRMLKQAGAKVVWDFAGGAPYMPMDMSLGGVEIDAIVFSPHKFIGGPGASGVLVVRRDAVTAQSPARPGGGTVAFVNGNSHDYTSVLEEREEGGTPNIIGDIRAALAVIVKEAIGQEFITERNQALTERVFQVWGKNPKIKILGADRKNRLPIFSFIIEPGDDQIFDYQLFTRALSDIWGIQARGGCACAGPYVHRLLDINDASSAKLRQDILSGDESKKPGFVRLNFSVLMDDGEIDFILNAVESVAARYDSLRDLYAEVNSSLDLCCSSI